MISLSALALSLLSFLKYNSEEIQSLEKGPCTDQNKFESWHSVTLITVTSLTVNFDAVNHVL